MYLRKPISSLFIQMKNMLELLTDQQYTEKIGMMSNSSIGDHIRHVIEFYLELNRGYSSGNVNYDLRKRDNVIESNKDFALLKLEEIMLSLDKPDRQLELSGSYALVAETSFTVPSSYHRELIYNLEHTIHHMALMRIAVAKISLIQLPEYFGLAVSTIKYKQSCAQ
ncbi:hypothetical protein AQ505_16395 [Pedobacter sp. PACM 27299]|uniref:hypothetical protein n=1 Tax=Pedobacter sp. PACM 27299 TaxID=1727164 RepID=UPI0007063666|nr:hypothetical protein [Pedobacter sp. PACM 27299]ALL06932.1 hypothetical protein AQ505_16395 [Pedobacter sp. PACM 27299]